MVELPTIILDTTIAALYRKASPRNAHLRIAQVLCGTNSGMSLSDHFPRNVKYLYQDKTYNTLPREELKDDNRKLQRSLAMKYLSLVPQRDAFISGDTAVVMFNINQSPEQMEHDRMEAERTVAVLDPKQRPTLVFCAGPGGIPMDEHRIDRIACKVVLDQLGEYPAAFELDKHWFVNSKAALARSGLPTPKCEIIEIEGYSLEADQCCSKCRNGDKLFIAPECTGVRGKWLNEQADRVLNRIRRHPLPFVVKNQQTFGGAGTYVIASEDERSELIRDFSTSLLRRLISQVTAVNHHLSPGTILLSDLVRDPIGDYGLTFFVKDDGGTIFLAASEQMTDADNAWIGSTIDYSRQQQLETKFTPIMHEIAQWLHSHDYYGPVGADILETKRPAEGDEPRQTDLNIVDLNVRTSGSVCLPLLRGHFESRGLTCGSSFQITTQATRDAFIQEWRPEFEEGRMFILSWYEDRLSGVSIADVAVGGEDGKRLREQMKKVQENTDEVTF